MTIADFLNSTAKTIINPLSFSFDLGMRAGTVSGNNVTQGLPPFKDVLSVLSNPVAPVTIINPKKTGLDALGVGFVEKNLIIVGVFALGAVAIWKAVK